MTSDHSTPSPADPSATVPAERATVVEGPTQPVIARYGQYYRNTRYIMATLTVVMGFWFGYDGFVRWPAENVKIADLEQQIQNAMRGGDTQTVGTLRTELKSHSPHSPTDVQFQKVLAFGLPPLGIALLLWALYNSRGEYRLAEMTLHVPGHPPIPLSAIRELDERSWERKGIAVIRYEISDGENRVVKLDDFVYDRPPTDEIYERIKAHLRPPASEPPSELTGELTGELTAGLADDVAAGAQEATETPSQT